MRRLLPYMFSIALLSATAHAGLFDDEEARKQVAETKRRVEDVNRQLDLRIADLESRMKSQGLLDLFTQVEALKTDLAKLRGQIEVLDNEMETTLKRQRDLYVDLDTRMRKVETVQKQTADAAAAVAAAVGVPVPGTVLPPPGIASGPGIPGAVDAGAAPPAAMVPGVSATGAAAMGLAAAGAAPRPALPGMSGAAGADASAEQRAYDVALDQFKSANYSASLQSFINFVKAYPKSPLAPSAQYWVGNGHYALKDYRSAIASQRLLIATYPDSQKVPDSMLNISSSQIELGDTTGARRTLDELIQRYPASEAAERAKKRLAGAR